MQVVDDDHEQWGCSFKNKIFSKDRNQIRCDQIDSLSLNGNNKFFLRENKILQRTSNTPQLLSVLTFIKKYLWKEFHFLYKMPSGRFLM